MPADKNSSRSLETYTELEAGGTVSEKDLIAARQACLRSRQTSLGSLDRKKVEAALVTIGEEQQRQCFAMNGGLKRAALEPLHEGRSPTSGRQ